MSSSKNLKTKLKTCCKCGWVYFAVTRKHAEKEVKRFNKYFDSLSKKDQDNYYGGRKSSVTRYEYCWCGNKYDNFRDSKSGDCPDGCTINPIIEE